MTTRLGVLSANGESRAVRRATVYRTPMITSIVN